MTQGIIFGFLISMAYFGVYPPHTTLTVLVGLYTVFVGLVLYLVLALSDRFRGGIGVEPMTFELLVKTLHVDNE